MNPKNKSATLVLVILLAVSSLTLFEFASAQSTPKPSVPEFTVRFVDNSYDVTSTNSYTGVTETNLQINYSIEVTIKNQPFDSSNSQVYYNIRVKPHYDCDWKEVYPLENQSSSYNGDGTFSYAEYINYNSPIQSTSSYTIVTFPVVPTDLYSATGYDVERYFSGEQYEGGTFITFLSAVPDGAQIDFQVKALTGPASQTWVIEHPFYPTIGGHFSPAVAYDTASGWSNTQTVTISGNASPSPPTSTAEPRSIGPDPTLMPTSTAQQPETQTDASSGVDWKLAAVGLAVMVAVLLVVIGALAFRRGKN